MFLTLNTPKEYEILVKEFFSYYRTDIIALHTKQWKQEDLYDKSCTQYLINQYYLALYLVLLIKVEVDENLQTDWQYYIDKYELTEKSKKFACNNISLKKILDIFGLPTATDSETIVDNIGISFDDIGNEFIIGGIDTSDAYSVDILDLLAIEDHCVNFLIGETEETTLGGIVNSTPSENEVVTNVNVYYGISANAVILESEVLTFNVYNTTTLDFTVALNPTGYKYIVIPLILGTPSDFIDFDTDLGVVMDTPVNIDVNGVPCMIYRSFYELGSSINITVES